MKQRPRIYYTEEQKALYKASESLCLFTSERSGPMGPAGFRKQLARGAETAKIGISHFTSTSKEFFEN